MPLSLKIDKTAPVTTVATTTAPNGANGWFITAPVTVHTQGTDAISGIASCTSPDQLVTTDTAGTTLFGTCTDMAGNSSTSSTVVKLDTTDPIAAIIITSGTEGANGWYTSSVIATASGSDNVSGPVVCALDVQSYTLETTGTVLSSVCTNEAGRTTTPTINVKIDKTAPVIVFSTLPALPDGDNGWFISNVTLVTVCTETISPVVFETPAYQVTTETAGLDVSGMCTNEAGLSSSATKTIKLDKTGPTEVMLAVSTGNLGDNGWYTTDVVVSTAGVDDISGPVTCTADQPWNVEEDAPGHTFNGSCTNQAGLLVNAAPLAVKIDKTPPTDVELVFTGTTGNNGWWISDVLIETVGVELISDPLVCTPDQNVVADIASLLVEGSCENNAGLITDAAPVTIKVDKTPPTLTPILASPLLKGTLGIVALPNATDETSGVATSSCAPVVTTAVGTFTVVCTATDFAGNTGTASVEYEILDPNADCGQVMFGTLPSLAGGFGTFAFSCGSLAQLLTASGCPAATSTFYYNKPGGGFAVWLPGTTVAAANAEFLAIFNGTPQIPPKTIFTVKCV